MIPAADDPELVERTIPMACFVRIIEGAQPPCASVHPPRTGIHPTTYGLPSAEGSCIHTRPVIGSLRPPRSFCLLGLASCEGGGPTSSEPVFTLSANELVFSNEEQQQIAITNLGSDPIDWRIETSTASWLNGVPSSGRVDPHGSDTVRVRINRVAVSQGTHSATLTIGAGGQSRVLSVSVHEANPARAALTPQALTFSSTEATGTVEVVNSGGSDLNWDLSGPGWVSINPSSGNLNPGGRQRVALTALPVGLTGGLYNGALELSSNGGSATTSLSLTVVAPSGLRLDPGTLDFGTSRAQMSIRLVNDGETAADWVAQPSTQWVFLSKTTGRLPPKLTQLLTVEITRSNLSHGINQGAIQFSSNVGTATAIVMAGIVPAGGPGSPPSSSPKLAVSPVALDFGNGATEQVLNIRNDGDLALDWRAEPEGAWISMPLASGRVAPHSSTPVVVRVSRAGLTVGLHQSFIQITSNGGSAVTTVAAVVSPQGSPSPPPPPPPPPGSLSPEITLSTRSLDFGETAIEQMLRIKNEGDALLTWSAQAANAWVTLPISSGQLAPAVSGIYQSGSPEQA